ncbi:Fic family protein [Mariprofundus sp. KV]|uniref:Fic family protein n=1 Tax=Mariprofundus sp. KV TaxID=2608715 RepID=UPI0015A13953|nr:Fic family protein [Mariprofundus sp. KV]NWF35870.1 Fic family protein [Mariprofundus sp. KV]
MIWNWQRKEWPEFSYDAAALHELEQRFLRESGMLLGAYSHFNQADKMELIVDLISDEALKSSAIEGEILNRDSLQSSIRRNFGLATDHRRVPPAEQGIAQMMISLYHDFNEPLSHATLFKWHRELMSGRADLHDVGCYRKGEEPMQVISGSIHNPRVHFEAPPSAMVYAEMDRFVTWFNNTSASGNRPMAALLRAGLTHLYFVTIHPFEDGNGRIGRALAEKALAQSLGQPALIALSQVIERHKKEYYRQLELHNKHMQVTSWLHYFAQTTLSANRYSQSVVTFLLAKTRLYESITGQLNLRQKKVIERIFREGVDGFKGGLSAENYISITGTSRATATRDLNQLLELGAFIRTGSLKGSRYWLNLG